MIIAFIYVTIFLNSNGFKYQLSYPFVGSQELNSELLLSRSWEYVGVFTLKGFVEYHSMQKLTKYLNLIK